MTKQTPSSFLLIAAIAGGIGFVAFVALMVVGQFTFSPALFLAVLVALGAAIFLFNGFHKGNPSDKTDLTVRKKNQLGNSTRKPGTAGVEPGTAGVGAGTTTRRVSETRTQTTTPSPDITGNVAGTAPSAATGGMPDTGPGDAPSHRGEKDPAHPSGEPAPSDDATASDAGDAAANARKWTSSQLPGSQEFAERTDARRDATDSESVKQGDAGSAQQGHSETAEPGHTESAGAAHTETAEPGHAETGAPAEAEARPRDDHGAAPSPTIGTEPSRLSAPREGGADDLKRINGVGPKIEAMLHRFGIYHFDQIASWSEHEVVWVDEHLEGFKGRVSRDEWVTQARDLTTRPSA